MQPLFQALYDNGVDVVLNGHDHAYERMAPMDPNGVRDPARGVRQFLVGTGGKSHNENNFGHPSSELRNSDTFGVLKLTLRHDAYRWEFVPEAGGTFTDAGANSCH